MAMAVPDLGGSTYSVAGVTIVRGVGLHDCRGLCMTIATSRLEPIGMLSKLKVWRLRVTRSIDSMTFT